MKRTLACVGAAAVVAGMFAGPGVAAAEPAGCTVTTLDDGQFTIAYGYGTVAVQGRDCDGEWAFRATAHLAYPVSTGEAADAYLDTYVDGVRTDQITCDSPGGSGRIGPGGQSCTTGWVGNDRADTTFLAEGYVFRVPMNQIITSAATTWCNQWQCV